MKNRYVCLFIICGFYLFEGCNITKKTQVFNEERKTTYALMPTYSSNSKQLILMIENFKDSCTIKYGCVNVETLFLGLSSSSHDDDKYISLTTWIFKSLHFTNEDINRYRNNFVVVKIDSIDLFVKKEIILDMPEYFVDMEFLGNQTCKFEYSDFQFCMDTSVELFYIDYYYQPELDTIKIFEKVEYPVLHKP